MCAPARSISHRHRQSLCQRSPECGRAQADLNIVLPVMMEATTVIEPAVAGVTPGGEARALPDAATSRDLLRQMAFIRRFEEEVGRQYQRAKAGGFLHLAIGEEATIVGTTSVMRPEDYFIGTYRTHGHALARGTNPNAVMAEIFGRVDGCVGGRGGSMHIFDLENRMMGGYGIVGGNLPLGLGMALAADLKGTEEVTVCSFGDGAANQGNFGETLNMAALWNLPIVFLIENNLYGMGTALDRHSALTDLSRKGEGFGVPGVRVDGMDLLATREVMAEHIRIAREERRPTLVEAITYRYRGHSVADPQIYRSKDEIEAWRESRDPIEAFSKRMIAEGQITQEDIDKMTAEIEKEVKATVEFADNSAHPDLDTLYDHLYVIGDQVKAWYAIDERSPDTHRGEDELKVGIAGRMKELAEAGAKYGDTQDTKSKGAG